MIRNLLSICVALFLFTFGHSQTVIFTSDGGTVICQGTEIQLDLDITPDRPRADDPNSTYNVQWESQITGGNFQFIRNCSSPDTGGVCNFLRVAPDETTTYRVTVNGGVNGPIPPETITITVEETPNPGLNTSIFLCGRTGTIDLFDELDGGPEPGGVWSNGTGTFDTSNIAGGSFTYTIGGAGGACPAVSSVITIRPCGNNDIDNDGVPNTDDTDNDNDGIPNIVEDGNCTASTETPIFVLEEDFGFGGPTRSRFAENLGLTYTSGLPQDTQNDGEYNVATSTFFRTAGGFDATFLSTDIIGEEDANGDVNGRYMAINMKSSVFADEPVFVVENLPVTPGIEYDFSMSIASLNNNAGERPANLTIEVVDQNTGVAIFSENSGEIANGTDQWILVEDSFIPAATTTIVTIRVINNQNIDGNGNDIGIDNVFLSTTACDFDRDGIPNSEDLDADNDGIYDIVETGNAAADADGDGRFDGPVNGTGGSTITPNLVNSDTDTNDNYLDIDSDGDGIIDNVEGQSTAGFVEPSGVDGDFNGVDDSYDTNGTPIVPVSSGAGAEDYVNTNSDGDCLNDTTEGYDIDQDGIADIIASGSDDDGDGLDNFFDNVFLDRLTGNTNAGNGGTVPGDFPNNHNPITGERDWREEIGDVRIDPLNITVCEDVNLFDQLPETTLTTGTWTVPTGGLALTGDHLGTLDPTAPTAEDGEYIYTLPILAAGCPPIRYLIAVTIDDSCQCPFVDLPVVVTVPEESCLDAVPLSSATVTVGTDLVARWYIVEDDDTNTLITRTENGALTFTPESDELSVGTNTFRVEAFNPTLMCTSELVDVVFEITEGPEAGVPVDEPVSLCEGSTETVDLFDQLDGEDAGGIWTDPSGNPVVDGMISAANEEGTYIYTVTDAGVDGCDDTAEVVVEIDIAPTLASGGTSCTDDRASYSVTFVTNGTWEITVEPVGAGTIDVANSMITGIVAEQNITITATNPDNDTCTAMLDITAPNCNCPDIAEPTNPSGGIICTGNAAPELSVDVIAGQTANWYLDGILVLGESTTYTPVVTEPGIYTFTVEALDVEENCPSERIDVVFTILSAPVIEPINPINTCESYELPSLVAGNYFTETNGGGTQLSSGDLISVSQTLFVYAETGTTPNCFDEEILEIIINPLPILVPPIVEGERFCENYTLPDLLSGQNYFTEADGLGTQLSAGDVLTTSQTIFLREVDANTCANEVPFFVEIINIQELEIEPGTICLGPEFTTSFVIDTELGDANFSFEWLLDGTVITGATQSFYEATEAGTYTVNYLETVTMCPGSSQVTIIGIADPESLSLELTNGSFADDNDIIATVVGDGTYEYSLDNDLFQDSNVFTNVSPGLHTVTASDLNGCGSITEEIFVVGFPNFFTPNNDGINDFWNVTVDASIPDMDIFIFDRFGQVLAQITPSSQGWDGMYNGRPLPSTDYWFLAEFKDGSGSFRKHFTLKR